ncbi:MAG TPA: carbohydrate-binding protein [Polyangia bacterium]|jgi:hypothetical protein|nr:carbohydrate-binding protein [Polyangia bacterium]
MLSLALAVVATVGCGDKITNVYIINGSDGAADGQPANNPPPTDGAVAETAGEAGAPTDGGPGGAETAPVPTPPGPDAGPPMGPYAGKPWNGMPQVVPGTLQFEFYDLGGEGIAYHDTDAVNQGSGVQNIGIMNKPEAMFRRMEGVDITYTRPGTDRYMGGMNVPVDQLYVGWTSPGEWLKYTINVTEAGNYMLSMHTSANLDGSTISFTFEDGVTTGALPIPFTTSWNIWEHVDNMAIVKLTAGMHVMTVRLEAKGNNNLDYLIFTRKP